MNGENNKNEEDEMCVAVNETRLDDFWKFLAKNLLTKVAQKRLVAFGLFRKGPLYVNTTFLSICANLATISATFLFQYLVTLVAVVMQAVGR